MKSQIPRCAAQPAYFLGRPSSLWIEALSRRQRTKRHRPHAQVPPLRGGGEGLADGSPPTGSADIERQWVTSHVRIVDGKTTVDIGGKARILSRSTSPN
jgi:hypothetical protein